MESPPTEMVNGRYSSQMHSSHHWRGREGVAVWKEVAEEVTYQIDKGLPSSLT